MNTGERLEGEENGEVRVDETGEREQAGEKRRVMKTFSFHSFLPSSIHNIYIYIYKCMQIGADIKP